MTDNTKSNLQYSTAIGTVISGVIMCFLSFFLNDYVVDDSVLWYFGETLIFCGAVFGVNVMLNQKIQKAETRIEQKINKKINNNLTDNELH